MKTINTPIMRALTGVALSSLATTPVFAANQNQKTNETAAMTATRPLHLQRAESLLGSDVVATDGRKIGDIVDFAFQFDGAARLTHVLIMDGGVLDMGGDVRAVPAEFVSFRDDSAAINISSGKFEHAPLVTNDRAAFFADAVLVQRTNDYFGGPSAVAGTNRAIHHILYGSLEHQLAVGADGTVLGRITDAWVNLGANRAPLVEIDPSTSVSDPFEVKPMRRFELPASKLERADSANGKMHFALVRNDLIDAPHVASIDSVAMEYSDPVNDRVMQLTLPATGDEA